MNQEPVYRKNTEPVYRITNHSGRGYNSLYSGYNITMYIESVEVGRINSVVYDDHNDNTEDEDSNHYYYFYIYDLFVEPEFRMRGYANLLIEKIKQFNKTGRPMIANCNELSKNIFENNGFTLKEKLYIMEL